jgi:hypothetical protein
VEHLDQEYRSAMKRKGYQRAVGHLKTNRARAVRVAEYLIENGKIDQSAGVELLASI